MHKNCTLFLSLSFFSFLSCFSQDDATTLLKGAILNSSTGEAISYATISLAKTGIKTMSNAEGKFIFKIPSAHKKDSILISHIGYKPVTIIVNDYHAETVIVKLEEIFSPLSEVVVKTINPIELIKKAIVRIPDNYATTPYILNGFYRVAGKKEKNIVDFSEAVFEVYNETYLAKNKQFKVLRARLDKDLTAFGGMDGINIGSTPSNIMEMDAVSNANESGLLSKEGLDNHSFTYRGIVNYNGQEAHKIVFEQKEGIKKSLDDGIIYLDVNSLAFLHITTYKSPKGIKYWDFDFKQKMLMKLVSLHIDLLQDSGYITYRKYGDKYYVNDIDGIVRWHMIGGRKHFELNPLRLKFNYIITKIDTANAKAFKKEEVHRNAKFLEDNAPDKNTDSTDAFWGDYNLIQDEFNVDSVAKVIRANNETLNYKKNLERQLAKYKKDKAGKIDSILSFYYLKGQFNGTALVKYDGKVIYEKGFGLADKARNLPNTLKTQFRIGSTSKQFTAMLIMQLLNENKLKVEDTVGKFLPGYINGRVTIQQLLTHQSGIPNYLGNPEYVSKILSKKYSPDELVANFCSDSLEFEPGTQINYSNSGFVILADIIEKITGKKYGEVLSEKIFMPLGMLNSYFGKEDRDKTNLAIGYINEEPEMNYPVGNEAGTGGITSTAEDLLLWHNALSSNILLPKEKMDELFKPRVEWDEWGAYYGYGWMIDRFQFEVSKKHTVQYHPGTEVGFYDILVRQPDKDIFIILLNNKSDFPRFDITDLILQELN